MNRIRILLLIISLNLVISNCVVANENKTIDIKIKDKKSYTLFLENNWNLEQKIIYIQGFTIVLNTSVEQHREVKKAINVLTEKLTELTKIVKPKQLEALKEVPIWIEWERVKDSAMCYHVSKEWLVNNGYSAKKAKTVEVSNVKLFLAWQKLNQPYMVLHEFAHAYHDKVLGMDNEEVTKAYENAVTSKIYDNVEYNLGGKKRAYGLNNSTEYFAELTEAYLGKNDFYPYTREQLKTFDPIGYELMKNTWD